MSRRDRRYRRSRVRRVILLCILLVALAAALVIPFGASDARAFASADLAVVGVTRSASMDQAVNTVRRPDGNVRRAAALRQRSRK